jgi:acyl-CoA synthetase (AMP-forming)/AMP-acid ligase II
MEIIYIILGASLILNLALFIGVTNLLKQNEEFEDTVFDTISDVKTKVSTALDALRDIDLKGSFESDDEVGVVFKELKEIVENLNEIL